MQYSQKSFTVSAPGTKRYAENWERTFGKKSCPVHPGGNDRKSIGLMLRDGETENEAYARWALNKGSVCTCPQACP